MYAIDDHVDVGWLRVDIKPAKQVLITHASKCMWTHIKYLISQVCHAELVTNVVSSGLQG